MGSTLGMSPFFLLAAKFQVNLIKYESVLRVLCQGAIIYLQSHFSHNDKLFHGANETEAHVVAPFVRSIPAATGTTNDVRSAAPATAPFHAARDATRIYRVIALVFTIGILAICIFTPLPYITAHIIYAQTIGCLCSHWTSRLSTITSLRLVFCDT